MGSAMTLEQRLELAGQTLGVPLSPLQVASLLAFLQQMHKWNRTYNLTALREVDQMLVQHVFDSLSIVLPVRERLLAQGATQAPVLVDVGSGGGLPGIVLAAIQEQWQVHCVDAVEKKTAFVRQISSVLSLPNLHSIHARIETLPFFNADIVVSRAFASLSDFAILAGKHVASQGCLLAMKGREPEEEVKALEQETEWRVERIDPLVVPELNAQRCLVWMSRQGNP